QRDPLAVAKSLSKRNGFTLQHGVALWEFYNRNALVNIKPFPCFSISYERLLAHPINTAQELFHWLEGQGESSLKMPANDEITSFISERLNHDVGGDNRKRYLNKEQADLLKI